MATLNVILGDIDLGDVVFIVGAFAMALQVVLGLLGKIPALPQPQQRLSEAHS
ncbi:hypothetical protein [Polaromonas sp.]|uniref:hypothetical protein n=1 Tax=Polaromonas sp. TaxID=1869339 RepID=UPI003266FF88